MAQTKVADKTNEITTIPQLLDILMIKGCVTTADVMGCQKGIAAKVKDKEANYIVAVKNIQEHLLNDLQEAFNCFIYLFFSQYL